MAVDREALTKHVTRAGEIPTTTFVPAGMRGYEGVRGLAYDPAAAKKLLAEAGFPDGKGFPKVELVYNTNELHRVVTQAIQQMWKETLGIQVEGLQELTDEAAGVAGAGVAKGRHGAQGG